MRNLNRILTGKRLPALWLAVLLLVSLFPLQLSAAKNYTVETIPNVRLSDRNNHVSNPDGIIQPQDVDRINRLLQIVEDSLGIEVAVVAVESIGDNDARMFATDLFQHWGLGKKDKDNGLLIQLVTEPTQRSVVFETGYGIEGVLPDAICYRLQQRYMIPDLKAGEYSTGMLKGVAAVKQYLMASDYERAAMTGGNTSRQSEGDNLFLWLFMIMMIVFPAGIFILVSFLKYRPRICPRCGQKTLVYVGQQVIQRATYQSEGLAEDTYRCKNCGYTEKKNRNISRLRRSTGPIIIGGGGRGGGFGGGFGGFGGSSRRANPNAPRKGQDIRVRITLSFDEAVHGCKKNITITRQQECTECHGSGCAAGTSPETCPDCGGRGFVIRQQRTPFGVMQTQQPCSRCGGKGKLVKNPCKVCHGSGKVATKKTLEVSIPMGIDDDQSFALRGMGDAGANGGPSGDVIVMVTVRPSEVFQRDGYDVWVTVPITYSQAVLGDNVTVPSIDGKVEYTVPEGTQSGTTFRLRGKGIQYLNGRGRGDMYVKCEVEIPKKLNKTQREALKKFEGTLKEENYEKRKGFFKKLKDMFNA